MKRVLLYMLIGTIVIGGADILAVNYLGDRGHHCPSSEKLSERICGELKTQIVTNRASASQCRIGSDNSCKGVVLFGATPCSFAVVKGSKAHDLYERFTCGGCFNAGSCQAGMEPMPHAAP